MPLGGTTDHRTTGEKSTAARSHQVPGTGAIGRGGPLPAVVDVLFVLLALGVPFGLGMRIANQDGDLGRHLRVGEEILRRGGLFYEDPFSYTMAGQPFVPFEWLSEVLFALAFRLGGMPAMAVLTGLVIALTYALVVLFLRRQGMDPLLALLVGVLAALVGSIHWLARPHIFTALGAVLTLMLLERGTRGRGLLLYVPLFAAWANLHGGFLYGLILIGVYLAGDLAEMVLGGNEPAWRRLAVAHAGALGAALVGSLLNPVGPALFSHVTGYLGQRYLLQQTIEYRSPNFHLPQAQLFLLAVLLLVALVATAGRRPSFPRLLLLLVNLAFALYSARNIPLFAVTALPAIALAADPFWRGLRPLGRFRQAVAQGERFSTTGAWALAASIGLVLLALASGRVAGRDLLPTGFDASRFPVEAVQRARAAGLQGRIFNEFGWGGYLLYAWPEQRVFMDGQTDFYGEDLARAYVQVTELRPGWRDVLQAWDVSLAVLPTGSPLAHELAREPGWQVWYRDDTAAILRYESKDGT